MSNHWSILPSPVLPGNPPVTLGYALLHPERGVALLDVLPETHLGAATGLQDALSIDLPVIYQVIETHDLTRLPAVLHAALPIVDVVCADPAWQSIVIRALGGDPAAILSAPLSNAAAPVVRASVQTPMRSNKAAMLIGGGVLACALVAGAFAPKSEVPVVAVTEVPTISAAKAFELAQKCIDQHDIQGARRWYEAAFAAGDGTAAVSLGVSYDPKFLTGPGERELADPVKARGWYAKAKAIGGKQINFMLKMVEGANTRR